MLRQLLLLVCCTTLVLHSCSNSASDSGAGLGAQRVQHLDPRLVDGRAVADVLGQKREERDRFTLQGQASVEEDLPGWELVNARVLKPARKQSGVHIRGEVFKPESKLTTASLKYVAGIDAAKINVIEVDMRAYSPGSAAVRWNTPRGFKGANRVELALDDSRKLQTVRFLVGTNRNWFGQIPMLEITPMSRGMQSFDVVEIRFVSLGYCFGPEPLSREGPEAAGDGGLVGFQKRARRVWPGDLEVPMYEKVTVPRGGMVSTRIGLPPAMQREEERLSFAIDARLEGESKWNLVERMAFVPDKADPEKPWHHLLGDLGEWAGKEVELRLRAWEEGNAQKDNKAGPGIGKSEPQSCRVWWGEPIVYGDPAEDRRPDVILVTLDTTRTDAIGCYGGPKRTPEIDKLASEGWVFESAWSGCNSTLPSHTSILTGLEVPVHGVLDNRSMLAPDLRTLAQHMRAAGYLTAAAVSVEHLQAGYSGLGRGFDQFIDVQPGSVNNGALTLDGVEEWFDEWGDDGPHPIFLWVHLFDPHTPYGPPKDFMTSYHKQYDIEIPSRQAEPSTVGPTDYTKKGKFLDGVTNNDFAHYLYEAGVSYSDDLFGRLRELVVDMGSDDETLWILTSDHGEAFGEMDVWYNHAMLTKPVMEVPCIVLLPGEAPGHRIKGRVSTVELAGSLARYLGLDPIGTGEPRLFEGKEPDPSRRIWFSHSHKDQIGFRDSKVHFFENFNRPYGHLGKDRQQPLGMRYMFDVEDDAHSLTNVAAEREAEAAEFSSQVHQWSEVMSTGLILKKDLTPDEQKQLNALGYGGGDE
ncbi:MAG: arylsulfatase [Planctomycetota bacterium]